MLNDKSVESDPWVKFLLDNGADPMNWPSKKELNKPQPILNEEQVLKAKTFKMFKAHNYKNLAEQLEKWALGIKPDKWDRSWSEEWRWDEKSHPDWSADKQRSWSRDSPKKSWENSRSRSPEFNTWSPYDDQYQSPHNRDRESNKHKSYHDKSKWSIERSDSMKKHSWTPSVKQDVWKRDHLPKSLYGYKGDYDSASIQYNQSSESSQHGSKSRKDYNR